MLDYLTLKPEAFGLEISGSHLRIIKLRRKGLVSWGEERLEPGTIKNGELRNEKNFLFSLEKLLKNIEGNPLKTNYAVVSLEEERAFLQTITLPQVEKEYLTKAVFYEAENYIPLKKEESCMDFEVISPKEVLVAAYPKDIVLPYLSCLKKTGLRPKALETESQAIARALIKNNGDYLIVDAKEEKIVILIYSQGTIRFTSTLEEKFLLKEIKKCFVYCQSKKPKIILNRGTFLKEKLISLGCSVQNSDPWANVFADRMKKIPEIDFEQSLNYSVAIGLALRGMKKYD